MRARRRRFAAGVVAALVMATSVTAWVAPPQVAGVSTGSTTPVLAYYYIWFSPSSWSRAKIDFPQLGRYDSADPAIIAQHVAWAKSAGIDGFIVSWKHEARLDAPLKELVAEADRQNFKLVLLYEGLDVNRDPIGAARVESDLLWFDKTYGDDPAFNLFGRPAVVWSGTWKYTPQEIGAVRTTVGAPDQLLLLGSERSAADYQARQALFDGDAYYWSSGDPLSTPGYNARLQALGEAVTASGGQWIAPVAPGFDARLVGGTSVVPRRDGATYRASWAAATSSNPSAVGIISWNEFSENSHIEPSQTNGFTYLDITGELSGRTQGTPAPVITTLPSQVVDPATGGVDSSDLPAPIAANQLLYSWLVSLGLLGIIAFAVYRARVRRP